ncbi:hypothetical protein BXZ70DRAFT_1000678 [Cristinia sonorae]|uniref:Fork-head domain-containing protein n=1 Tax=Cristinia sonorae TaxID=1940300 RepID=A0A8K0XP81_9AGAR|nr:hypothetical protein BXZ70DRAFT_1000678 [Cristinia sonorae]
MASLNTLLNPENANKDPPPSTMQSDSHSGGSPSPDAEHDPTDRATSDEPTYYQSEILARRHPKHENCPDKLDCLPDTDGRPQHTLPVILRCAILGSPKQRLTIREIYAAMEKKYSYYTTAGPAWKQSVRHHLSLNRLFERQPRPATEPGFGSYWTVNLLAPPGTKRPRKRGGRKKAENGEPVAPSPPKKPEHPQRLKDKLKELKQSARSDVEAPHHTAGPGASSTGMLRPVDAHSFSSSAMRGNRTYDTDNDDLTLDDGQVGTEDEFESEDDAPYHREHSHQPQPPPSPPRYPGYRDPPEHRSHSSLSAHSSHSSYAAHPEASEPPSASSTSRVPYPVAYHPSRYQPYPRPTLHGAFSGSSYGGPSGSTGIPEGMDAKLEKMQREIDALKRQSTEQMQASMRMSDQLAEAQAEASRSKGTLMVIESRLEDERRRRVEAEKAADEELRIRRSMEDQLRAIQIQSQTQAQSQPRSYSSGPPLPRPLSRSHLPPPPPS